MTDQGISAKAVTWQRVASGNGPDTPLVSVLVLVYNHAEYLEQALDSVLMQKVDFSYEVLVGEDCSTDSSLEIARRYEARYPGIVKVITARENVGMHQNHRRLVAASQGKYIAYCEGDDYWNNVTKLSQQIAVLIADADCGFVHSDFAHIVYLRGKWRMLPRFWGSRSSDVPQGNVFDELLVRNFIQTCTLVVRGDLVRAFMASALGGKSYAVGDWPLCLFASAHAGSQYVDQPLSTYRRVEGSATNRGADADLERLRDHLRMVADFGEYFGTPPHVSLRAEENHMRSILATALRCGDSAAAKRSLSWFATNASPTALSVTEELAARLIIALPLFAKVYRLGHRVKARIIIERRYRPPSRRGSTARSLSDRLGLS